MPKVKKKVVAHWEDAHGISTLREGGAYTSKMHTDVESYNACPLVSSFDWNAGLWTAWLPLTRKGTFCAGCLMVNQNLTHWSGNYKQKVTRLWKCQMEKKVRWNFLFVLTDDIFSYLQRCNLESLRKSKTKSTKENKLTSVSGSVQNGNACVGRGMHVCTTAITRSWLEAWSGQVGAEKSFCARHKWQPSQVVKLLQSYVLSCTKATIFCEQNKICLQWQPFLVGSFCKVPTSPVLWGL